jgi:Ca2+/Na+ antiporter
MLFLLIYLLIGIGMAGLVNPTKPGMTLSKMILYTITLILLWPIIMFIGFLIVLREGKEGDDE